MRLINGRAKICVAPRYASHKWPSFFMEITLKHFYFIKDSFYKFADDPFLMQNKEDGLKRPCYLAIKNDDGIIWFVPVSSKYEKFQNIHNKKIKRYGQCDTLVFGSLLGRNCVFLIQNMFPTIECFIEEEYIQESNGVPVSIPETIANEIITNFKRVLAFVRNGNQFLVFPDILALERRLKKELLKQK